jgi:hypothetical protein
MGASMAIEQTDYRAAWSYKLDPRDKRIVLRKRNAHGARWETRPYREYDNEHDARAAVLRLGRIAEEEGGGNGRNEL